MPDGYQPDESLTGGPPRGLLSGIRARPRAPEPLVVLVTLEPRVVRALELEALAQWADAPAARKIACGILRAWEGEGERCDGS